MASSEPVSGVRIRVVMLPVKTRQGHAAVRETSCVTTYQFCSEMEHNIQAFRLKTAKKILLCSLLFLHVKFKQVQTQAYFNNNLRGMLK